LPLGVFWLMDIRGFCEKQQVQIRQIVGGATTSQPLLHLGHPMKDVFLAPDASIAGNVAFDSATNINLIPGHDLVNQSELKPLAKASYRGLASHLEAPFTEEWLDKLKIFFPELKVRQGSFGVNLNTLNDKASLILVRGDNIQISGQYRNRTPLIILAEDTVEASNAVDLNRCWIIARKSFRSNISLSGSNAHILSPRIEVLGEVSMVNSTLTAIPWPGVTQTGGSIKLSGKGSFSGALTALFPDPNVDPLWINKGFAAIAKERHIDSQGYVFCDGHLSMRGNHSGPIRAKVWKYQDRQASFPGRLSDLVLTPSAERGSSLWGIQNQMGSTAYTWEAR